MVMGRALTADERAAAALQKQRELELEIVRLRMALKTAREITYTAHLATPREALARIQQLINKAIGPPIPDIPPPRNRP